MKQVKWNSEKRIIPKFGVVEKGDTISLPKDKADSFIKQGLAEVVSTTKQINEEKS